MKSLLAILILATASITWAQDAATCSTLYSHGDRDVVLCHAGDTFTKTDVNRSAASEVVISEAEYTRLMTADAADLTARVAQLQAVRAQIAKDAATQEAHHAAVMSAMKLTNKKVCTAAGLAWSNGVCSVKEGR